MMRKRGEELNASEPMRAEQVACRVILRVADNRDTAAVAFDDVALGDRVERVVGALAVDVRLQRFEQRADGRLGKDDDVVDAAQRRDELGPIGGGQHRPPLPFQRPHRVVVIDRDDQSVCLGGGGLQIADVADVQQVEASVGERHASAGRAVGAQPARAS